MPRGGSCRGKKQPEQAACVWGNDHYHTPHTKGALSAEGRCQSTALGSHFRIQMTPTFVAAKAAAMGQAVQRISHLEVTNSSPDRAAIGVLDTIIQLGADCTQS